MWANKILLPIFYYIFYVLFVASFTDYVSNYINKSRKLTDTNNMSYFNYHAKLKNLIKAGNCIGASLLYKYHTIIPAMVFYFNNHKPMPVRDYRWSEYLPLIKQYNIKLNNPDNLYYEE